MGINESQQVEAQTAAQASGFMDSSEESRLAVGRRRSQDVVGQQSGNVADARVGLREAAWF